MNLKSLSPERLIRPSGKTLLVVLTGCLMLTLIALPYSGSLALVNGGILVYPWVFSIVISATLGFWGVPLLRRFKTGQVVQEDGPQAHLKKAGTPTMGGVFFVPTAVILAVLWVSVTDAVALMTPELIAVSLVTLGYGMIGWIDDWQVLRQQSNKGLSPRMKLLLQVLLGGLFAWWLLWHQAATVSNVSLPGGTILHLGWLFIPLAIFVLAAESNATNLTDGVDGLAGGTGAIAFFSLGVIVAQDNPSLAIFCACLGGGCLGFLVHNHNPATVFMGDTGSLALGGALAAVGLSSGNLWALFLVSGIFFVESLSVIAQVSYYKATKDANGQGRRLFKMAPLHHHFELSGWSETQVVGVFYLVGAFLGAIAYVTH